MIATYELEEAQRRLPHLVRQAAKGDTVAVAEGDETVAYVVAKEHYESLIETIELMSNPAAMAALRRDKSGKSRFRPLSTLDEDES
jgi:PHD/YefM family antitoxin component YafN of YafNO toxin-antitoxin module